MGHATQKITRMLKNGAQYNKSFNNRPPRCGGLTFTLCANSAVEITSTGLAVQLKR